MKILTSTILLLFATLAIAAQTPDGVYDLDKDHAHVGFSISHLGFSNVIGRFNTFNGEFVFQANGDSSVNFVIQTESVDTNQAKRDDHIRSDDFLNVDNFPTITFSSESVTYSNAGDPKTITGSLNLHGVTNTVTFDVQTVGAGTFGGKTRAGYVATTKIERGDYGIDTFAGIVGEEVTITVNIEIIKQ